jgi:thiamine biosynthesis protein ThiI
MKRASLLRPTVLIRFSEIAIKSSKTRRWLTQRLIEHIKYILKLKGIENFEVINDYSRLFIESNNPELVVEYVSTLVPGAASLSIVNRCETENSKIEKIIEQFYKKQIRESKSFAVRVRRTGEHSFSSVELAAKIGEYIITSNSDVKLKVDLTDPGYTLHLDVRGKTTYVFDNITKGLGGLPVGCQGNVLVLISGEEEDIANIFQLYKRGANTFIYSISKKEKLSEVYINRIEEKLILQPKIGKMQERIFFIKEDLKIYDLLGHYDNCDCKGIAVSRNVFNEVSSKIPVTIPIFVPHLVTSIDENDL